MDNDNGNDKPFNLTAVDLEEAPTTPADAEAWGHQVGYFTVTEAPEGEDSSERPTPEEAFEYFNGRGIPRLNLTGDGEEDAIGCPEEFKADFIRGYEAGVRLALQREE